MIGLSALLGIALIVLNIFVLIYLDHLEKIGCECAKDWRKTYIFVYLIISLIYGFSLGLLYGLTKTALPSKAVNIMEYIIMAATGIMTIAGILYIIFALQYIYRLRDMKCSCAKNLIRDIWEIVLYIQIALFALGIVLILVAGFTVKDFIQKIPYYKKLKLDKLEKKIMSMKSSSSSSKR